MFALAYHISVIIPKSDGMTLSVSKHLESIFLTILNKAKISGGQKNSEHIKD